MNCIIIAVSNLSVVVFNLQVTVHTSKIQNGGSDAKVFLEITGKRGCSGPLNFSPEAAPTSMMKPGEEVSRNFKVRDLGRLKEMVIWHTGLTIASGWHLDYCTIECVNTGKVVRKLLNILRCSLKWNELILIRKLVYF